MAHIAGTTPRSILSGIILFAMSAAPALAGADSVTLTEGRLTFPVFGGGSFLSATGPDFSIGAASGPFGQVVPSCAPCTPGSSLRTLTSVDFAIGGAVTYKGVSQIINDTVIAGEASAGYSASAGFIVVPPIGGDSVTVIAPFQLVGHVGFATCPTCLTKTPIDLTGGGVASFSFTRSGSAWNLTSGVYDIMAPEPGTGLLVVTAAVGLALLWWRPARRARASAGRRAA